MAYPATDLDVEGVTADVISSWRYLQMQEYFETTFSSDFSPSELRRLKDPEINGRTYLEGRSHRDLYWIQNIGMKFGPARAIARDVCRLLGVSNAVEMLSAHPLSPYPSNQGRLPPQIELLIASAKLLRASLEEALGQIAAESVFANPKTSMLLPFPFISAAKPTDRFRLHMNDDQILCCTFNGRAAFTQILNEGRILASGKGYAGLWVVGTAGFGKSHEMAKLAIFLLTTNNRRVVFISDCRACAVQPVRYLQASFILAYSNDPTALEQIGRMTTKEDIKQFVDSRAEKIYFLMDQYNSLETRERTQKPDALKTSIKADVRTWLLDLSFGHYRILCSSSNQHVPAHALANKNAGYRVLSLVGGYNPAELLEWWNREGSAIEVENRSEIASITGRVPLLLDMIAVPGGQEDWRQQLVPIGETAQQFSKNLLAAPGFNEGEIHLHLSFQVKGCILGEKVKGGLKNDLIDHRFFYRDTNGNGNCTNMVVQDAMWRWLQAQRSDTFSTKDLLQIIPRFSSNPSMIGFAVKAACLTSIMNSGLPIEDVVVGLEKRGPIPMKLFSTKIPDSSMLESEDGTTLYCPTASNFPSIAVDAIICVKNPKKPNKNRLHKRKITLLPIQITSTMDPSSHSDSEMGFFSTLSEWQSDFPGSKWDCAVIFVWIGGNQYGKHIVQADTLKFKHPSYTRYTIPLEKLEPKIASALKLATTKISTGTKRKLPNKKESGRASKKYVNGVSISRT